MHVLSLGRLPWMECFIFGALISPTDPIAVLEMLRRTGVPKRIQAQLAGESLFNDGIGAVLFITMLAIARGNATTPWHVAGLLIVRGGRRRAPWNHCGLHHIAPHAPARSPTRSTFSSPSRSLWADMFSPIICTSPRHWKRWWQALHCATSTAIFPNDIAAHEQVDRFWEVIDEVQNSVLFVLLGLEAMAITLDAAAIRAGLSAIVLVNVVRFGAVALLVMLVRLCRPDHRSSLFVLTWGGLRGGFSIALALSVPAAFGRSWILGATYLVVVFSIVIQGGSMDWILRARKSRKITA